MHNIRIAVVKLNVISVSANFKLDYGAFIGKFCLLKNMEVWSRHFNSRKLASFSSEANHFSIFPESAHYFTGAKCLLQLFVGGSRRNRCVTFICGFR